MPIAGVQSCTDLDAVLGSQFRPHREQKRVDVERRDEGVHTAAGRRVGVAEPRTYWTLTHHVRQRAHEARPTPQRVATYTSHSSIRVKTYV